MSSSAAVELAVEREAGGAVAHADVLSLFLRLLPPAWFVQLRREHQIRAQNNRVYNDAVVIWLMILQRLLAHGSLETAVLQLIQGLPPDFWPLPSKRVQRLRDEVHTTLSSNTGSYNEARQALPLAIVAHSVDAAFRNILEQAGNPGRPAFFVDGSSARMPHREALLRQYPPGSNQHGTSHWPLLRMVVAHDLYTGLGMRPEWGALNGPDAVSEQTLLERAIDRLPGGALVMGDANFGVFSVAYAATERDHPILLRLTVARARHLAGGDLRDGMDVAIHWTPSRDDRRKHPELPVEAHVQGRLIVRQVQPNGGEPMLLALFTTLQDDADAVVQLYGHRWNIETDLRSLKQALMLEQLTSTTPEMVAKEIDVALLAYNLVRAVICMAAQKADLKPRQFSFTRVRNVINAFAPRIAAAADPQRRQLLFDQMMYYVGQAKLPHRRTKRPSYPRAVWPKPYKYPKRKR